ncbi:MAG: rod shape-determining protein MreC [Candidatus Dadabacteria bacterium]|nr:rod shape-determining protein MreC [Candidatus Dadabacteria bacterium]NIQ14171.1 rod shape-determining protein MreC [Candidatus Dadabacteria bacterium]
MLTKFIKNYPFVVSFIFIFFSIQIIPFAFETEKKDNIAIKLMMGINYYPTKLLDEVKSKINDSWDSYIYLVNLKEENNNLKKEIEYLKSQNYKLEEIKTENYRLKNLLDYKELHTKKAISANVIAGSPSIIRSEFVMIDKGENKGIKKGMPVSTPLGVVGRIHSVGNKNSMVMLITDPISAIDAIVHRTRARGIVKGLGNKCILKYIENAESISIGDKIISSGKDGIYPKGILIGTITKIEANGGLYDAIIEPEVNTNTLEEVLIIVKPKIELAEFNE